MNPIFFENASEFRIWLQKNHAKETELLVGYYKIGSGKPSLSWSESVDEALCFGWIDGVRRSVDSERYSIRFSPRKKSSIWSNVNMKKMEALIANGKMQRAGLEIYEHRKPEKSGIYSFENEARTFEGDLEKQFKSDAKAWDFFNAQPPGYKKQLTHWVVAAKLEKTRLSRLEKLIAASREGKRIQ